MIKVLVACEYSGTVRDAFIRNGHDAISMDLLDSEGSKDGQHIVGDISKFERSFFKQFHLLIGHPPCTYLSTAGNKYESPTRAIKREAAARFVRWMFYLPIPYIALENPSSNRLNTMWRRYDQKVEPYEFGHSFMKGTGLWLKNLPPLQETRRMYLRPSYVDSKGVIFNWKARSKTFLGIANAMAKQWGTYVDEAKELYHPVKW